MYKQTEKYILKKCSKTTKIAKNIFGNIVKDVFYAKQHFEFCSEKETISEIDSMIENSSHIENSIDQDASTIVIEFLNGKKVMFSNSEWGSMTSLSDNKIKNIV